MQGLWNSRTKLVNVVCRLLWAGLPIAVAGTAHAAPKAAVAEFPAWLPLRVGVAVPLMAASAKRQPWCNFGEHARSLADMPLAVDPVFRTPSATAKAQLGVIRKTLLKGAGPGEQQLEVLLGGAEGPGLARLALQDRDAHVLAPTLRAARGIMAANPRLAAMMLEHLKNPDPTVARAAVQLVFASGCDAPVQYGMDGLRHADESVQLTVLQEVGTAMRHRTDIGLPDKVMAWLEAGEGKPRARLAALRMLAELGWLPATPGLERLARGPQPDESAEALAALAVVAPTRAAKLMTAWLSDRQPVRRAAAARAVVEVMALEPARAAAALQPLLADGARGADPLQPATTVGEVARRAMAWVRMEK